MNSILKKHYINIFFLGVFCSILFSFVAIIFSKVKKDDAKILEIKEKIVSYEVNKKAFKDEVSKLSSLQEKIYLLEEKIIKDSTIPNFLEKVENLAKENSTNFDIMSMQSVVENETKLLALNFKSSGSYEDIMNLILLLQKQDFQIKIEKITMIYRGPVEEEVSTLTKPLKSVEKAVLWEAEVFIKVLSFK